jgi:vibriolysin
LLLAVLAALLSVQGSSPVAAQQRGGSLLQNGSFEQFHDYWPMFSPYNRLVYQGTDVGIPVHSGEYAAWLGEYPDAWDEMLQAFRLPSGESELTVEFFVTITTQEEAGTGVFDRLVVTLEDGLSHETVRTVAEFSNEDAAAGWQLISEELTGLGAWSGEWLRLRFHATSDNTLHTGFVIDDVSVFAGTGLGRAEEASAGSGGAPAGVKSDQGGRRPVIPQPGNAPRAGTRSALYAAADALRADPALVSLRVDADNGAVASVSGHWSADTFGASGLSAPEAGIAFFEAYGAAFGLHDPAVQLEFVKTTTNTQGNVFARYRQVHEGVPVYAHEVVVQFDASGAVVHVLGNLLPGIASPSLPSLSASSAVDASEASLGVQNRARSSQPELVVYSADGVTSNLAWRVVTEPAHGQARFATFVDAVTGAVLQQTDTLETALNRQTHSMAGICDWNQLPGNLVRSEGQGPTADAVINAAHDNAKVVYDFYLQEFGRDSFDDNGATIISSAHVPDATSCEGLNNGFWNGTQVVYGDGDGVLYDPIPFALDFVAHEITHAVTDHTSGLIYEAQSGALNESMSDVFATLIEPDPLIFDAVYTPDVPGDGARSMENPYRGGLPQPRTWYEYLELPVSGFHDQGGVHFNSGITNNVFWELQEQLNPGQVAAIYYDAQTNRLTSGSGLFDARDAIVAAAEDLYGSSFAQDVADVWADHGIGEGSRTGEGEVAAGASVYDFQGEKFVDIVITASGLPSACEGEEILLAVHGSPVASDLALVSRTAIVDDGEAAAVLPYPSIAGTGTRYPVARDNACLGGTITGDPFSITNGEAPIFEAFEGWNLIASWPGSALHANDNGGLDAISAYFNSNSNPNTWTALALFTGGEWQQRFAVSPLPAFQTLDDIAPGDDVWVNVTSDSEISLP